MNTQQFLNFTNTKVSLSKNELQNLENIIQKFPYFQAARAIYLKGLYQEDSYKYNFELKKTAAITTERNILFEYITSKNFSEKNNTTNLNNIIVNDFEIIRLLPEKVELKMIHENIDEIINQEINHISQETSKQLINKIFEISEETFKEELPDLEKNSNIESIEAPFTINFVPILKNLEIGKPLAFNNEEKHSFFEWLKISQIKPIQRTEIPTNAQIELSEIETASKIASKNIDKKKKNEIIDQFLIASPKISSLKIDSNPTPKIVESTDKSMLMTETLAKVYLEQKKYDKAIQAFQILILKNPEKSVYFANRIKDIKILQQNNI